MKDIHVSSTTKLAPDTSRKKAIRAYYAMRELAQRLEAECDELRKKIDAIGKGWEIIDDVEYPVGRAEVLIIRHAVWNVNAEEWQDVLTNDYLRVVVAYRDLLPPQDMTP